MMVSRYPLPATEVLIVPGFFEHKSALWALCRSISAAGMNPSILDDRIIFRDIKRSVDRIRDRIDRHDGPISIVTHSFGDWLVRQALDDSSGDPPISSKVDAFIGIAPVMQSSWIPRMAQVATGDWIPELKIIADNQLAAEKLAPPPDVRRMVIWATLDAWVRPPDRNRVSAKVSKAAASDDTRPDRSEKHFVLATHLSVVWQPAVHRLINEFLQCEPIGQMLRI